jgi:transposase
MIPVPSGVRVWLATGHTDMRKGMNSLALQVQEGLKRNPHAGDLFVFRGRRGTLIKVLWHDPLGMSLYPSGWRTANSFGPRPRMALSSSLRGNSVTCSKESIGGIRYALGNRKRRVDAIL